jgi:hypothetical protein
VEEYYYKEIAKNTVIHHIIINLRDGNDESEISGMEGDEDDASHKPLLFHYYNGSV